MICTSARLDSGTRLRLRTNPTSSIANAASAESPAGIPASAIACRYSQCACA